MESVPQHGQAHTRAIAAALLGVALLWTGLEILTRFELHRISRSENRRLGDYAAARALRPAPQGQPSSVLLLGNSLLLDGLDYERIRQLLWPRAKVVRFAVESTAYFEWYFGIRTLLDEGSRPDFIILCLSPSQIIASSINSDFATHYLFEPGEIPAIRRALHYDLTQASSLAFSEYSLFYARRNALRSFLLGHIDPPYSEVIHEIATQPAQLSPSNEIERTAEARLRDLARTATSRGSRFALLIPPGFGQGEGEIRKAAERAGTTAIIPFDTGALPATYFSDGFHLNHDGAHLFTKALAAQLLELLQASR